MTKGPVSSVLVEFDMRSGRWSRSAQRRGAETAQPVYGTPVEFRDSRNKLRAGLTMELGILIDLAY